MNKLHMFILGLTLCLSSTLTLASNASQNETSPLSLAALLISDGNFQRAQGVLESIEVAEMKSADSIQYHLLSGLLNFKQKNFEEAKNQYNLSIDSGQKDKLIYIYLAQSHYALNEYEGALRAIDMSAEVGKALPSVYSLMAQCHWQLLNLDEAWAALDKGAQVFPEESRFQRQKIYYLLEKGLYQTAIDIAQQYLKNENASLKEYIALGRALRQSGQTDHAAILLEKAKLLFSDSVEVTTELAHVYIDQEKSLVASDLFYSASIYQPILAADTAELYRQSGRLYRALNINSGMMDQKSKFKQRLAILLELGDFESVAAMHEALKRAGLYENQDILYAHAYSLYRTGDFTQAKQELSLLTRNDLFRKATELRAAMDKCKNAKWQCY